MEFDEIERENTFLTINQECSTTSAHGSVNDTSKCEEVTIDMDFHEIESEFMDFETKDLSAVNDDETRLFRDLPRGMKAWRKELRTRFHKLIDLTTLLAFLKFLLVKHFDRKVLHA